LNLAFLSSRLRVEEKLLLEALEQRGVQPVRLDDRQLELALDPRQPLPWDAVWMRTLAFGRGLYAARVLESRGVLCVNSSRVAELCGDKLATTLALEEAAIPTPRTRVAFTPESAMHAAEELGWPVVLKPVVGSWGRLVARLDGASAAEAVFEDRATLGSWQQQVFYLQEFVEKPGRDARVFVIGDQVVGGVWRHSEHWITNTARGGRVERCDVSGELGELSLRAARAVGGGILAVDLVESERGPLVLEVNHSGEFRNSIEPTAVDQPRMMADFVLAEAARARSLRDGAAEALEVSA